ncbi:MULTISPECIES: glutathione S-transferase family protein [unclassified Nostoc]|uniref:glutathione S-transferase family protein n=1 Tax=unclassified Nostoc TaxID=2593658 RepID=UPI002AD3CA7E|nr:glutathione S-transferase family protein [Nostoc sp. DedQUE03]MDZ7975147.1 glutathione S-transferase family protein [Nostoc sp. DedQUE03]MDZ8045671.1 glutathione S-transferase family protein [Nostoc sp. DedQUE02]
MIELYYSAMSPNSRRVWVALLEKNLEFQLMPLKLNGDQFQPDFLSINPFHEIPVLVDNGFKVVESLAILDYLEVKYPAYALLPNAPKDLAIVKMVEMVTANKLLPEIIRLFTVSLGLTALNPEQIDQVKQKILTILQFFESLLDNRPYFGSENITLAEAVAGTVVPFLPLVGVPLNDYQKLNAWVDRLKQRPAWIKTQYTPEQLEDLKTRTIANYTAAKSHQN